MVEESETTVEKPSEQHVAEAEPSQASAPVAQVETAEQVAPVATDEGAAPASEASESTVEPRVATEAPAGPEGTEGPKRKRKRRRRKKKGAGDAQGESQAEAGAGGGPKDGSPKRTPHVPFLSFFEGPKALERKHAFAAGEVVAGRVSRVEGETIFVDLFGKAMAVMDLWEPREVPEIPVADAHGADGGSEGLVDDSPDGATADGSPSSGPTDSADAAAPTVAGPSTDVPSPSGEADSAEASTLRTASTSSAPMVAEGGGVTVLGAVTISDVPPAPTETEEEVLEAHAEIEALAALEEQADADGESDGDDGTDDSSGEPWLEDEGPAPEPPAIGSIMRGRVGSVSECGSIAIVNRIVDREAAKARLIRARDERRRVRGLVYGFNRGGFDVLVAGVRVFCPANGMSLTPIDDPWSFVGQRLEFTAPPRRGKAKGFVVSRRTILERDARKRRKTVLRSIEEGQELTGTVTQIRDFGVFVDVGEGLEGMVHQSELDWRHGAKPSSIVKIGEEVRAKVIGVTRDGKNLRNVRISLSLRALKDDPWDAHKDLLVEGGHATGKVVSLTDFGAFVELAEGIEGLLHISELGKDLKHASLAAKEGDEVRVAIERVDRAQRRISLCKLSPAEIQAIDEGTFDAAQRPKSLKPGSHIKVVVGRVDHAGVQVQVRGVLGKRGRGFITLRDLGSLGAGDTRKSLAPGSEIDVKIVGVDRRGGLKCSVKGMETDAERQAVRDYKKETAKQSFGTFGDLLRTKLAPDSDSNG